MVLRSVQPVFVLVNVFDKQITAAKAHVFKGEKLLSARTEIAFTELFLFVGMKQAMSSTTILVGRVPVCFRKMQRFLSCHFSLFSSTNTVTVSSTPKLSTGISSADLTD